MYQLASIMKALRNGIMILPGNLDIAIERWAKRSVGHEQDFSDGNEAKPEETIEKQRSREEIVTRSPWAEQRPDRPG